MNSKVLAELLVRVSAVLLFASVLPFGASVVLVPIITIASSTPQGSAIMVATSGTIFFVNVAFAFFLWTRSDWIAQQIVEPLRESIDEKPLAIENALIKVLGVFFITGAISTLVYSLGSALAWQEPIEGTAGGSFEDRIGFTSRAYWQSYAGRLAGAAVSGAAGGLLIVRTGDVVGWIQRRRVGGDVQQAGR